MSVDGGTRGPLSGLTPLSSGPLPLTKPAAWMWAVFVITGTLFFGVGLHLIASRVAQVTVPPGAIVFGTASIIPADGWSVTELTANSVTLDKAGVRITFRATSAHGGSAAARAQDLADQMQLFRPQLTVASDPVSFSTPTGAAGQLIALAGADQTSIVASVVDSDTAVDATSVGESNQFGESIADIEDMIESIRILGSGDG